MKKAITILLWSFIVIVILVSSALALFIYKIKNGFPVSYETDMPAISFPAGRTAVLLFSKSTGFRHEESIQEGKKVMDSLAAKNNWFLYSTEEGGVFNPQQLTKFNVVIFNNCSGKLLTDAQQKEVQAYVTNGGSWIGIHSAGDDSHHWSWYEKNLVGANFSHHPLKDHFQKANVVLNPVPDSFITKGLPAVWPHTDEWYVFFNNPRNEGFHVLYNIDGTSINPDGNVLWVTDKNFGMGKDHPVAWYRKVGAGWSFYTSMGHDAATWHQPAFVQMLQNEIEHSRK